MADLTTVNYMYKKYPLSSRFYKMVQTEHTPRLRMRLYSILSAFSGSASLAWTMVQISRGTGRSDAPPTFICVWGCVVWGCEGVWCVRGSGTCLVMLTTNLMVEVWQWVAMVTKQINIGKNENEKFGSCRKRSKIWQFKSGLMTSDYQLSSFYLCHILRPITLDSEAGKVQTLGTFQVSTTIVDSIKQHNHGAVSCQVLQLTTTTINGQSHNLSCRHSATTWSGTTRPLTPAFCLPANMHPPPKLNIPRSYTSHKPHPPHAYTHTFTHSQCWGWWPRHTARSYLASHTAHLKKK